MLFVKIQELICFAMRYTVGLNTERCIKFNYIV